MLQVLKRDGTTAPFDIMKVAVACQKAAMAAQLPNPNAVALTVASEVEAHSNNPTKWICKMCLR